VYTMGYTRVGEVYTMVGIPGWRGVHHGGYTRYASLCTTVGIPPCVYTLLYTPGYTVLYVCLPYPGCPVCSVCGREGPGLIFENSYGPEARRGLQPPKGVREERSFCAELLRFPG